MQDAFGVDRDLVSKGVPSVVRGAMKAAKGTGTGVEGFSPAARKYLSPKIAATTHGQAGRLYEGHKAALRAKAVLPAAKPSTLRQDLIGLKVVQNNKRLADKARRARHLTEGIAAMGGLATLGAAGTTGYELHEHHKEKVGKADHGFVPTTYTSRAKGHRLLSEAMESGKPWEHTPSMRERLFASRQLDGWQHGGKMQMGQSVYRPLLRRPGVVGTAVLGAGAATTGAVVAGVKHHKNKDKRAAVGA